jgi:hypothetical protein
MSVKTAKLKPGQIAKDSRRGYSLSITKLHILVLGLVLVATGGYLVHRTFAASPNTIYVSTAGNDSTCVANNQSLPCASFAQAYVLASPGDTVEVEAGSYPSQFIPASEAKTGSYTCTWNETFGDGTTTSKNLSGCIRFEPYGGAVTVTGANTVITIDVPYVLLDDINPDSSNPASPTGVTVGLNGYVGGDCSQINTTDDILENVTAETLGISGGHYIYVVGGTYGNTNPGVSNVVTGCNEDNGTATWNSDHIAIDGATFENVIQTCYLSDSACGNIDEHMECVHWFDGVDSVIQNTKFLNCAQLDISIQCDGFMPGCNAANMLVQNNIFDSTCSHQTQENTWTPSGETYPGGTCSGSGQIITGCSPGQNAPTGSTFRFNSFGNDQPGAFGPTTGGIGFDTDGSSGPCFSPTYVYANTGIGYAGGNNCPTPIGVTYFSDFVTFFNAPPSGWTPPPTDACGSPSDSYINGYTYTASTSADCPFPGYNASTGECPENIEALYTNQPSYNFTPPSGAPQLGYITSSPGSWFGYPPTDILGNTRSYPLTPGAYQNVGGGSSAPVVGDLNGDGAVNALDLSILLSAWGTSNSAIATNLNNTGVVGSGDLTILLSHWGQ